MAGVGPTPATCLDEPGRRPYRNMQNPCASMPSAGLNLERKWLGPQLRSKLRRLTRQIVAKGGSARNPRATSRGLEIPRDADNAWRRRAAAGSPLRSRRHPATHAFRRRPRPLCAPRRRSRGPPERARAPVSGQARTSSARVPPLGAGIAVSEGGATSSENGNHAVPGDWLDSLAREMKLSGLEWRLAALVMAHGPISVYAIAKALRVDYTLAKRAARGLATWNVVTRSPEGLTFQSEPKAWKRGTHRTPLGRRRPAKVGTAPAVASPPVDQEIELTDGRATAMSAAGELRLIPWWYR